jgi:hypothetical protein
MDPRVAEHWGLIPTPIGRRAEYHGPQHAEALARLLYGVEQGLAVLRLFGPVGSGKTWLQQRLACELLGTGRQVAAVSLAGREPAEWLLDLTLALQGATAPGDSPSAVWRALADRLTGLQHTQRGVVIIADQVEGATPETRQQLARLARTLATRGTLVLVETLPASSLANASPTDSLAELIDLPVPLPWLGPQEIGPCLAACWEREAERAALATPQACDRLHRATGGSLRRLGRLIPLCLAAGLAFDIETIDAELVADVAEELNPHRALPSEIPANPALVGSTPDTANSAAV